MDWLNIYGLLILVVIMIPNIIYAIKCKDGFQNKFENKTLELFEQISRFGSFGFMAINVLYFGFWFDNALSVYLTVNSFLVSLYCIIWFACGKSESLFKALALSIIPSAIFIFSGIMLLHIPLIIFQYFSQSATSQSAIKIVSYRAIRIF